MIEISKIAAMVDVSADHMKTYGKWKGKISLESVHEVSQKKRAKLVLVTAMTPTPSGEGKTVTSIGLSMGLNLLGRRAVVCLRQPSLGPVFGVKGGAAGGGKSTVEPMQEINLRFTGDIDAIGAAHNLLSAMLDNHIFHGNDLGIDIHSIAWKRTLDMNERSLRHIVAGLGGRNDGIPREDGFIITAASEVMAVLCIATDYVDLKQRLDRMIVGYTKDHNSVRAHDLKATGAMSAILKDALEPNLAQTVEGTPALVHGGPFANIALGTCSLTSILFALNHAEFVVVEAGFATDLGGEKFFDVVSRIGGFSVDCAIIVASVRSLKYHGEGSSHASAISSRGQGQTQVTRQSPDGTSTLRIGLENLGKHIENIRIFGVEPIVAINRFVADKGEEIRAVTEFCESYNVPCVVSAAFEEGGAGCLELAERTVEACEKGGRTGSNNKPLYSLQDSIQTKIDKIVTQIYGGDKTEFEPEVHEDLHRIEGLRLSDLPICMAKTQLSLSDDRRKLGRPKGFVSVVRRLDLAAGAGFVIADLGDIVAMPGLPIHPAAENIDLDEKGSITGLY